MFKNDNEVCKVVDLSVGYKHGGKIATVLSGVNLSLKKGELVCLLGANGAGKSTLLRTLSGVQTPLQGVIKIEGRELSSISRREMSQLVSIVYTDHTLAGGLTVTELVALGRQPYTGFFGRLGHEDYDVVANSLKAVGISHKSESYVAQLSDGERQKAMIARALSQCTPMIILDEPTAFLDVASRIDTINLLHRLAHEQGKSVVLSSHDVGQSLTLADRLLLICRDGRVVEGDTDELIKQGILDEIFTGRDIVFDSVLRDYRAKFNN